jgi:hypothetical protein
MLSASSTSLSPDILRAANISPATYLATDFLNHYNEVAMLIDLLSMDPEVAEDILDWRPMSYVDHFRHSGFRDRELAIYAYDHARPELISQFEHSCNDLDKKILEIQSGLQVGDICSAAAAGKQLYDHISVINALIVGTAETNGLTDTGHDSNESLQSEIDSLFS